MRWMLVGLFALPFAGCMSMDLSHSRVIPIETPIGDPGATEFVARIDVGAIAINADIAAILGDEPITCSTSVGSVHVSLPRGADADITGSTSGGDIVAPPGIEVSGEFTSKSMSGTLGHGGHSVALSTSTGSVQLTLSGS